MIKRTILCSIIITLTLVLFITLTVSASPSDNQFDSYLDFAYENVSLMQFRDKDCYSIRAVYSISLPEDTSEVHQLIVSEYGSCQSVYLIEYGYADLGPIIKSLYVCIGEDNDSLVSLDTPYKIISYAYDWTIFDDVSILEVINIRR
jgi:hypothetical protein